MTKIFLVMERHGDNENLPIRGFVSRNDAQAFIVALIRACKISSNGISYWTEEVPVTSDTKIEERQGVGNATS